jgi:hypothetical protein
MLTLPKIVFPSGGGTTLSFVRPPRQVPYRVYNATRHDNYASAGPRESITERVDSYLQFDMEYVNIGSDVAAWDAFIQYALMGGPFDYYPDASVGTFATYLMYASDWNAAYKQLGIFAFSMKLIKSFGWP